MEPLGKKEVAPEESILGLVVYSPVVYLSVFLLSFLVDVFYPLSLGGGKFLFPLGVFFMVGAPLLILWSQKSIALFRSREGGGDERTFALGPYRFSRNPTYVGLALLILGFSFIMDSLPILAGLVISFHIVNLIRRREEALLSKKYGNDYERYRSKVRPWL